MFDDNFRFHVPRLIEEEVEEEEEEKEEEEEEEESTVVVSPSEFFGYFLCISSSIG